MQSYIIMKLSTLNSVSQKRFVTVKLGRQRNSYCRRPDTAHLPPQHRAAFKSDNRPQEVTPRVSFAGRTYTPAGHTPRPSEWKPRASEGPPTNINFFFSILATSRAHNECWLILDNITQYHFPYIFIMSMFKRLIQLLRAKPFKHFRIYFGQQILFYVIIIGK